MNAAHTVLAAPINQVVGSIKPVHEQEPDHRTNCRYRIWLSQTSALEASSRRLRDWLSLPQSLTPQTSPRTPRESETLLHSGDMGLLHILVLMRFPAFLRDIYHF